MFRTLDFWIQTLLMLGFIPPILFDGVYVLFAAKPIFFSGFSLLVAMFLGPYQIFSALCSLAYEREKNRASYLICVCLYFGVPTLLYNIGGNLTLNPSKFETILASAIPVFLAIWYYYMTYRAYKEEKQ
jgi:hypothetical protein